MIASYRPLLRITLLILVSLTGKTREWDWRFALVTHFKHIRTPILYDLTLNWNFFLAFWIKDSLQLCECHILGLRQQSQDHDRPQQGAAALEPVEAGHAHPGDHQEEHLQLQEGSHIPDKISTSQTRSCWPPTCTPDPLHSPRTGAAGGRALPTGRRALPRYPAQNSGQSSSVEWEASSWGVGVTHGPVIFW